MALATTEFDRFLEKVSKLLPNLTERLFTQALDNKVPLAYREEFFIITLCRIVKFDLVFYFPNDEQSFNDLYQWLEKHKDLEAYWLL
jgi:hypothetical protein